MSLLSLMACAAPGLVTAHLNGFRHSLEPLSGFAPDSLEYKTSASLSMLKRQNGRARGHTPRQVIPARLIDPEVSLSPEAPLFQVVTS